DAERLASVLQDEQRCAYPVKQVKLLCGADATTANILTELDMLANSLDEEDTLFLFYSGHGEYGDDGYYLTTHDTRLSQAGKVEQGSGIRDRELLDRLNRVKAHRLILTLNACHSGTLSPGSLGIKEGQSTHNENQLTGQGPPDTLTTALLGT